MLNLLGIDISLGALCFGLVIGWITYRTLFIIKKKNAQISDIAAVIAAVGGGGITALFKGDILFNSYCIGLAIGFFGFLVYAHFSPQTYYFQQ